MRRKSDVWWEFALALIALAGGSTLIQTQGDIRTIIIGSLFSIGFFILLVIFGWRLWEIYHPVKITLVRVNIDTLGARRLLKENKQGDPIIEIEMTFLASNEVRVSKSIILKFNEDIENRLKAIGRLIERFDLQTSNTEPFIGLKSGDAVSVISFKPLQMKVPFSTKIDNELENIQSDLEGKYKVGWQLFGGKKTSWYKSRVT